MDNKAPTSFLLQNLIWWGTRKEKHLNAKQQQSRGQIIHTVTVDGAMDKGKGYSYFSRQMDLVCAQKYRYNITHLMK